MGAKQSRLLQAIDPTGAAQREIEGRDGGRKPQPTMQEARVVGLRMVRRLRDEDDGIDLPGAVGCRGEEAAGGIRAKIKAVCPGAATKRRCRPTVRAVRSKGANS